MKKIMAFLLAFTVLAAMLLPMQALAEEKDSGLEKAIIIAKTKFTIPEDYKFSYSAGTEWGKTVWYLNWNSKDEITREYISVRIDSNGKILGYDKSKPYDYAGSRKLPKVSRQDALAAAEKFIRSIDADIWPQIKYREENVSRLVDYAYSLNFYRIVNDIPFYRNNAYVRVDADTGEVIGYSLNWNDNVEFPAPDGIISMEEAQKAYGEKLGLRLVYASRMENEKMTAYAIYTPVYDNSSYAVDAFTGEKVQLNDIYYGMDLDGGYNMAIQETAKARAAAVADEVQLTPEELEAVKEAAKLIELEKAEEIARGVEALELTDDFRIESYHLSQDWPDKTRYTWSLSFRKEAAERDADYRYASVTIDAGTGEVRNFYKSSSYKESDKAQYDLEASKAEVEKFLKEFAPDRFAQTEYDKTVEENHVIIAETSSVKTYTFRYIRKVNGILFPSNGITVGYDAVNGKITNFSLNWYDIEFPAPDNVISLDEAYGELYGKVGLGLQYNVNERDFYIPYKTGAENTQEKNKAQLVYCLVQGKPYNIDANTGELLDSNGKPYKEAKPVEYTDIDGHFAEEKIKILADYGIALEGTEFRPDENIVQKDFFILLSKVISNYYGPVITSESSGEDIEEMYRTLIREGIVREEEKAPDSPVIREDSVKFVIRALKFDKVADIKGIYTLPFKDADQISPALTGYVAIAYGLGIVNGSDGYFNPADKLTRAEAVIIIYNYLQG